MRLQTILITTVSAAAFIAGNASSQHIAPNALLTIDQNRVTVIDRIVGEWGDRLAMSNAGISSPQLRQILSGLRSDHLLAASLAGSVEGLRDVVSGALVRTDAAVSPTLKHTKALGDTTDDLVYTPVVPCRIVDTRSGAGGVFLPGNQRNWLAFSPSGFASQGGSATDCGISVHPAAVMVNVTLADTVGGPAFFVLWPFNQTQPLASTVNWWASGQQPANAEIVPVCAGCASDFSAYASLQTNAIIDVLGYFNRPTNYGGTHVITGTGGTDSGGFDNTASGDVSTVGGGDNNTASSLASTVAGGHANAASGGNSTVGGGDNNIASGIDSTVAGGEFNTASGGNSTVGGGLMNIASGFSSTINGGQDNLASGLGSSVAGGASNVAAGNYSFVSGHQATNSNPAHTGVFMFADGSVVNFVSQTANEFAVRATGGLRFVTAVDGVGNPTRTVAIDSGGNLLFGATTRQMINLYNASYGIGVQPFTVYFRSENTGNDGAGGWSWYKGGVHADVTNGPGVGGVELMRLARNGNLTTAGTVNGSSDVNGKTAFAAVNSKSLLARVASLPITSWQYRGDSDRARHIGPTAQDFSAAFGLGTDDKHISMVDADGVALAAIQGLHQMIKQKDARLRAQASKISAIERELATIKEKLNLR